MCFGFVYESIITYPMRRKRDIFPQIRQRSPTLPPISLRHTYLRQIKTGAYSCLWPARGFGFAFDFGFAPTFSLFTFS